MRSRAADTSSRISPMRRNFANFPPVNSAKPCRRPGFCAGHRVAQIAPTNHGRDLPPIPPPTQTHTHAAELPDGFSPLAVIEWAHYPTHHHHTPAHQHRRPLPPTSPPHSGPNCPAYKRSTSRFRLPDTPWPLQKIRRGARFKRARYFCTRGVGISSSHWTDRESQRALSITKSRQQARSCTSITRRGRARSTRPITRPNICRLHPSASPLLGARRFTPAEGTTGRAIWQ